MNRFEAVTNDLSRSMEVVDLATPIIIRLLDRPGYKFELKRVEGDDNEICKTLDLTCGIDYLLTWTHGKETITYGVGCRVQWVNELPFNTFTLRNKRKGGSLTEVEKLKAAIKKNSARPHLTLHIYADKCTNKVLSLAITKTERLIQYIEENEVQTRQTGTDKIGQAEFYYVNFFDMKKYEPNTYIWLGY